MLLRGVVSRVASVRRNIITDISQPEGNGEHDEVQNKEHESPTESDIHMYTR